MPYGKDGLDGLDGAIHHPFDPPKVRVGLFDRPVQAPAPAPVEPPARTQNGTVEWARKNIWFLLVAALALGVVPAVIIAYGWLKDEKPKDQEVIEYEPLEEVTAEGGEAGGGGKYGRMLDRARAWRARR
jgi:hypothetical protein